MIYVLVDKDNVITGAVDTKHIISFVYDGTSPDYDPRYRLKLSWGHDLTVSASDMQHILSAMENEANNAQKGEPMRPMRPIDADALMKKLGIGKDCSVCEQNDAPYCRWKPDVVDVCEAICEAPTIEVQPEIIHCPDCKYGEHSGCGDRYICTVNYELRMEHDSTFYCGYGKRRDSDGNRFIIGIDMGKGEKND